MAPVTELFARLGLDVDESAFGAARAAIGGLRTGLLAVGSAVAAMGAALAGAVRTTANRADTIDELSQRTGVAADKLQALGYAAGFSGVSIEEMAQALNFLARKGSKDVEKDIGKIADEIQRLTQQGRGAEAAALAMKNFGRAGARLVPVLNKGSGELARMAEEARAFGVVLDKEAIAAGVEFNDSVDRMNASLRGVVYTIAGPLLTPLREVIQEIALWVAQNRKLIASHLNTFVAAFAKGLKAAWFILKPMVKALGVFVKTGLRLKLTLIGLASVLFYKLATGLLLNSGLMGTLTALTTAWGQAAVLAGLKAALAPVLAAAPWVALIALIALAIEDLYVFFNEGDSLIGELGPKWTKFLDEFLAPKEGDHWLVAELKAAMRFITDIQGGVQRLMERWKGDFRTFIGDMLDLIVLPFRSVLAPLFALAGKQLPKFSDFSVFGGGASPAASVAASPSGGAGSSVVNAQRVNAKVDVNVKTGADAEEIGVATKEAVREALQSEYGAATAGAD